MVETQVELGVVVVVDDEELIINPVTRLLEDFFEDNGLYYRIVSSQSPEEVLRLIDGCGSDLALVISDVMMEPMGGVEFLRIVKDRYPEALLIVLTGFANVYDYKNLQEQFDLYSYQEKPWDDKQFVRVVRNALDRHRRGRLLNRYVPKRVVNEVLRSSTDKLLEGIELEATIMFLDIRDSTHLFHSDAMGAKQALKHLNLYFTKLLDVLDEYDGTLDKFMGDGIMALFGVPSPSKSPADDAQNAVWAALEMRDVVHQMNQQQTEFPLAIGIGISTGSVIAGNIGTEQRASYTVLGKDVNVAARLEKAAKLIDDGILISQRTWDYVKDVVQVCPGDPLPSKRGRDKVLVYQVLGRASNS